MKTSHTPAPWFINYKKFNQINASFSKARAAIAKATGGAL
jgi:hypothetical protein